MNARQIVVGGCPVDLHQQTEVLAAISHRTSSDGLAPLGVISVNLDHIHHFGTGSRWIGTLDGPPASGQSSADTLEWLNLIDGAPLASEATRLTQQHWPRLAGSDLIRPILESAERDGASVGFLGGDSSTHDLLRVSLAQDYPELRISGYWAPTREELEDAETSRSIAGEIARAGTSILVVGLGKPRQELWIDEYGVASGARVLLAFGAVVDFLAGRIDRCPGWVARVKMEWAWRLLLEPRRLARRYLVDGPPAYLAVRRSGRVVQRVVATRPIDATAAIQAGATGRSSTGGFASAHGHADVAVIVVTYNSADHLEELIDSLRGESSDLRLRVVMVDNGSDDDTVPLMRQHSDVIALEAGANLGYAGGINYARPMTGDADAVLILNPDLVVARGTIRALLDRLRSSAAGVVVPRILDTDGAIYHSLRREPSTMRALGDAVFGHPAHTRPEWSSEIDVTPESYRHAHRIDWATGAAMLVHRDVVEAIGDWDPQFFLYSEETDYFRRVRDAGYTTWFEPGATVIHEQGGSGSSPGLAALLTVNRVRYVHKHRSFLYSSIFTAAVALHEAVRSTDAVHRSSVRILLNRKSWLALPRQTVREPLPSVQRETTGSIIIPAHNEESVMARSLAAVSTLARAGRLEVIVVCNGCSDGTAAVARQFDGVRVIELEQSSKVAALNAGDSAASYWPRMYLDADVEIDPDAVLAVFATLSGDGRLAARPQFRYDTTGCSPVVRSYYRARNRMPSSSSGLWGAGAYALSERGHSRFARFPQVTADDLFVDQEFTTEEKAIVATSPVRVYTPRTRSALVAVLTRQSRGNAQLDAGSTTRATVYELLKSVRGPVTLFDACVYTALTVSGRSKGALNGPTDQGMWERDYSRR